MVFRSIYEVIVCSVNAQGKMFVSLIFIQIICTIKKFIIILNGNHTKYSPFKVHVVSKYRFYDASRLG